MPYCEKCGSQISENASFCHSCGARVIGEVEINDACVSDENTYQEDEIPSRKIGEVYKYNVAAIGGILTACTTLYISIDVIIKQINASQHKYWYPREGTYNTPGGYYNNSGNAYITINLTNDICELTGDSNYKSAASYYAFEVTGFY